MWINVKNNKGVSYQKILKAPYRNDDLELEPLYMVDIAFYCIEQRRYDVLLELEQLKQENPPPDILAQKLEKLIDKVIPAF